MKKLFFMMGFIGILTTSIAQKFDWVSFQSHINQVSNAGSTIVATTVDNQGFIYTVGWYSENLIVGADTAEKYDQLPNTIITKWNQAGQPVAFRQFHFSGAFFNEAKDLKFDPVSNQIVLSQAVYWPGSSVTIVGSGSNADTTITLSSPGVNIFRFNTNLVFQSAASPGGSFGLTQFGKIALKDGAVYTVESNSHAINKISAQNTLAWSKTSTNFTITDITITPQDTIFVIGYLTSSSATSVTLGSTTVNFGTPSNIDKVFIFKLDTAGNVLQGRFLAQLTFQPHCRITSDAQGNPYIFCPYAQQLQQVGGFTLSISPQQTDGFIAKMNKDITANFQWVSELSDGGVLAPTDLEFHPSGKLIALGTYGTNATFGQFALAPNSSGFLAQLNPANGSILYATNLGSTGGGTRPEGLAFTGNKYYVGGFCSRTIPNSSFTAQWGCFDQALTGHYLTCFNDTVQPMPVGSFTYVCEQNKVYFTASIQSADVVSWIFGDGNTSQQLNPTHTFSTPGNYTVGMVMKKDCFTDTSFQQILFEGIDKVVPNPIANNHLQIVYVKGGFPFSGTSGLNVILKKGTTILNADAVAIHDSGTIQANYFLNNEQLGFYDVIVNGPGGFTDTLVNGLEMVVEKDVPLSVQVIVNDRRLVNRYERVKVMVTNASNINKFAVPVTIALHSGSQIGQLTNKVITDSVGNATRDAAFVNDFIMTRDSITGDSAWLASLVLPMVGANSSEMIEFYVRGTSTGKKPIAAIVEKPLFADTQLVNLGLRTSCDFLPCKVQFGLNGLNMIPVVSCVTNAFSLGCAIGNIVNDAIGTRNSQGSVTGYAMDVFNPISDVTGILTCSGGGAVKKVAEKVADKLFRQVLDYTFTAAAVGLSAVSPNVQPGINPDSCFPPTGEDEDEEPVEDVASSDPNDKKGYMGYTIENYFNGQKTLHYKIRFENLSSATAPAQHVAIYDTIDTNFFDLSTLHFTGFGFADSAYQILNATNSYVQEMDLRPAKNTIVRFEAKLDVPSHYISWKFDSYDPITRGKVVNISDGFLNPNINSPEGQGFVTFSIMPKANRPHLQQVSNVAKIVFDENAPIFSDAWINTVDKVKPTSQIQALPATVNDTVFIISWTGSDAHAGIRGYDIFAIENDTATSILLRNTKATSAIFHGKFGSTYKFYSVAIDHAGNREDVSANPDAVITLQQSPISIPVVSQLEFNLYPNPVQNQLTIQTNTTEQVSVELIDLQGRIVMRENIWSKKNIDVTTFSNGVYQVKFTSTHGVIVKRFLKE